MDMRVIDSKKYKEKMLKIIMSDTKENPEFERFMDGLSMLKGQGEDQYIDSLIKSIYKTKTPFEKHVKEDENVPDGCISFVLFEREQRNCAFYYVMLIGLFALYNDTMEETIDDIYKSYNRDYTKLSEEIYVLGDELMQYKKFVKEKGLEQEYLEYMNNQ